MRHHRFQRVELNSARLFSLKWSRVLKFAAIIRSGLVNTRMLGPTICRSLLPLVELTWCARDSRRTRSASLSTGSLSASFRVRRVFQAYGAIVHNRSVAAFHAEQRVVQPVRDRPEAENRLDGATAACAFTTFDAAFCMIIPYTLCDDVNDDVSHNNKQRRVCVSFSRREMTKENERMYTLKEEE